MKSRRRSSSPANDRDRPDSHLVRPFILLLACFEEARKRKLPVGEYAVEQECLVDAGLLEVDQGFLESEGYLTATTSGIKGPKAGIKTPREKWFVLTKSGAAYALKYLRQFAKETKRAVKEALRNPLPSYDQDRREWRFLGYLLKRFKVAAPEQEAVLLRFQEVNWASRIDFPLPRLSGINPKEHLKEAIRHLNRNRKAPLIHMEGDGTGLGIRWQQVVMLAPDWLQMALEAEAGRG